MDYNALNWFEKFIYRCNTWYWDVPKAFGLVHILFILFVVGTTIFLCLKFKDCDRKTYKIILLVTWATFVTMEIFKQIFHSFHCDGTTFYWSYNFFYFPWQLCSSQYYVLPFLIFLTNKKVRSYFESYLSMFVFFGGFITILLPTSVLNKYVLSTIHSLFHHSLMVIISIFVIVYNRKDFNLLHFLKGIPVFLFIVLMSQVFNEMIHSVSGRIDCQMLYLSRFQCTTLTILNLIYPKVPYAVFFFIYIFGFVFIGFLINSSVVGILKLVGYIKNKKKPKDAEPNSTNTNNNLHS